MPVVDVAHAEARSEGLEVRAGKIRQLTGVLVNMGREHGLRQTDQQGQ
jgi:hypothetical protein